MMCKRWDFDQKSNKLPYLVLELAYLNSRISNVLKKKFKFKFKKKFKIKIFRLIYNFSTQDTYKYMHVVFFLYMYVNERIV